MRRRSLAFVVAALALAACGHPARRAPTLHNASSGRDPMPAASARVSGVVTEEAMTAYFTARFPAAVEAGTLRLDYGSAGVSEQIVGELADLDIDDMAELDAIVPRDLERRGFPALRATGDGTTNLAGLLRDLMIMHDAHRYFSVAWRHHWSTNGPEDFPIPQAYGVDFSVMRRLGVFSGGALSSPTVSPAPRVTSGAPPPTMP